jgi:hypothetical protein
MEAKRTPLTALAGHRRTIGRQGAEQRQFQRLWYSECESSKERVLEGRNKGTPLSIPSAFSIRQGAKASSKTGLLL